MLTGLPAGWGLHPRRFARCPGSPPAPIRRLDRPGAPPVRRSFSSATMRKDWPSSRSVTRRCHASRSSRLKALARLNMGMGCCTWWEAVGCAAADELGSASLVERSLRVRGFQLAQFPHQSVVLPVADDRRVVVVVPLVVEPKLVAQPARACRWIASVDADRKMECSSGSSCR